MPARLIATDLDGTLVHSDGSLTPRTRQALLAAEERGIDVVFVTGRPLRWARDVFGYVGGHGEAIVSNGALVWDVAADSPLTVRGIAPDVVLEAADRIRGAVPGSAFALETVEGIALEPGFMERYRLPDESRRGALRELVTGPTLKLLARHEELSPREYWDRAEEAAGDLVEIVWSSSSTLLEMSAGGVTKASTLELLCQARGISAPDVVAFGDMPNDLPMLSWAGTSYAMRNAHESVVAAVSRVAPSNDEDGVAQVIEAILAGDALP